MASDDKDFLADAREKFRLAHAEEQDLRREAKEDMRFMAGDQWSQHDRTQRERHDRPALTFNRLPTFVRSIANDARQNKPSIRFSPVDDLSDLDTAKVYDGIARHIQYASRADIAYETALEPSAIGGFGYFRLLTDFVSDRDFDQEIQFAPVIDPFSVYGILVPRIYNRKPRCAFVIEELTHAEFKAEWPKSELESIGFDDEVSRSTGWVTTEHVRIAEYWYLKTEPRKLQQLSTGHVLFRDEYTELPSGVEVLAERTVMEDRVHACKMNGVEVLPGTKAEWVGTCIPIFAVLGQRMIVDGKPHLSGVVRGMRDPQRLVNMYKSTIAEQMGLSNRVPYIAAEGQLEGYEAMWNQANVKNFPVLVYRPKSVGGVLVPEPKRNAFEPAIQGLSIAAAQEIDDMKAIAGIFDASLGEDAKAHSGIALQRSQSQAGLTNLHFSDNLHRAQEEAGEQLAIMIPKIYDQDRMIRIIGEEEEERVVRVNARYVDESGQERLYDLSAGKYDVTVSVGPTYQSKRQEAADSMVNMTKNFPQIMGIAGDLMIKNMDWPGAQEISERIKRTLPPGIAEDDKNGKKQPIPPEVQAKMQMLDQMNQQLTQALNELTDKVESKTMELESKERIEAMKVQAQLIMTEAKLGSAEGIALLREEVAAITERLALLNIDEPVDEEESKNVSV